MVVCLNIQSISKTRHDISKSKTKSINIYQTVNRYVLCKFNRIIITKYLVNRKTLFDSLKIEGNEGM